MTKWKLAKCEIVCDGYVNPFVRQIELMEVEQKPETMLDRLFGDPYTAADTLTQSRKLMGELKARGISMSTDNRNKMAEFFAMEVTDDAQA